MDSPIQLARSYLPTNTPPGSAQGEEHPRNVLRPPQLSRVLSDDDQLQPNPQQLEIATEKYRKYWYHLTTMAMSQRRGGILPASTDPRSMLGRVPAIRKGLGNVYTFRLCRSPSNALWVQAFSTWRATDNACRDLSKKEKKIPGLVQIGTRAPIPCSFSGDSFRTWIGTTDEERDKPGYLGILALGWSYILSARLVEIQGEGAKMIYTGSKVTGYHCETEHESAPAITVGIGEVDEDVARWWAALLAPGEGWKAIISRRDDGEYLAPWSVSREDMHCIGIKWRTNGVAAEESAISIPPSSSKAFELLAQFSLLHNLESQFLVALATTITFPTHNYHGTTIRLPLPTEPSGQRENAHVKSIIPKWVTVNEELPYYMALSCNPEVVISSLCGTFWESDVPCNLVSPWLHPIINEVPEGKGIVGTPGLYHEILALVCGLRQPRISALWLGAVASGLTLTILCRVREGSPPLEPNAFPWTGCPQSFMDIAGSGPYICERSGDKVRRADVWRLLYLPTVIEDDLHYNSRPFAPWAPCGNTSVLNCVLRVASHLGCPRHHLNYQHWNWELKDGSIIEDQGFDKTAVQSFPEGDWPKIELITSAEFPKKPVDQGASEEASFGIFQWVLVNGEGVPLEAVYKDEWIQIEDESDEKSYTSNDDNSMCRVSDKQQNGLEDWLSQVTEHGPT